MRIGNGLRSAGLGRSSLRRGALLAGLALLAAAGCDKGVQREFRAAAVTSVEAGVSALIDGVTSGIFAAIDENAGSGDAGAGSSGE